SAGDIARRAVRALGSARPDRAVRGVPEGRGCPGGAPGGARGRGDGAGRAGGGGGDREPGADAAGGDGVGGGVCGRAVARTLKDSLTVAGGRAGWAWLVYGSLRRRRRANSRGSTSRATCFSSPCPTRGAPSAATRWSTSSGALPRTAFSRSTSWG